MRKEFQVKVEGQIDLSLLLSLGAEPLGQVCQKDTYLGANGETWRIREEAGQYVLAQKGHDVGRLARVREVRERLISKAEADRLSRQKGVRVTVCKNRTLWRLGATVIAQDEVEHLGEFAEISSTSEDELVQVLARLGLGESEVIRASYLDMMVEKALPGWLQAVLRFHEKVGVLAFGITSGILTTVGVLTGVNSATPSKLSVIAAIVAIAVADSCSDSFGMFMSKSAERGNDKGAALRYALGTFAGKFIFPLTFLLPILFCPTVGQGVVIDLTWGAIALAALSAEQAIVAQTPIWRSVARNLGLAAFIVIAATLVGSLVARFN